MLITNDITKQITGLSDANKITELTNSLNDTLTKYNINTTLRVRHFLAQLMHESGSLKVFKENLNYSAKGLSVTFKKYFINEEVATPFARQPQKIANKVYANRMGNGSEESQDGFHFIGRGGFQITGRDNYTILSKDLSVDFVNHPELLETVNYAILSAGWFWNKGNFNTLADKDDILGITKKLNGGTNGLDDRKLKYEKLKNIIK